MKRPFAILVASARQVMVACAALLLTGHASAQSFPNKPITMIVPFPPGGPSVTQARILAQQLSIQIKQPVILESKPGASGNIGAQIVARAKPDGYTLFWGTGGTHGINPALYKSPGFDAKADFSPIALVTSAPNVIAVHPSFPAQNLQELIALAKAAPGKYSSAAAGTGTTPHMTGELFKIRAGVDIVHVPYQGSGPALTDAMAGHVPIVFDGLPSIMPHVHNGKLRAIAVSSLERAPSEPTIPAIAETIPNFEATAWFAVFAPTGTPPEIVAYLNKEINAALNMPEIKAKYAALGAVTVGGPPARLAGQVHSDIARWTELLKVLPIKVE